MSAAKKIRLFIEQGESPDQVQVLKDLAVALELGKPFDLMALYDIDMRYFDVALELLKDWRFDHHISSRSKLIEQLLPEIPFEIPPKKSVDQAESSDGPPPHSEKP